MAISENVVLGEGVQILHPELVNMYGCAIGAKTKIGTFVEIQKGVHIGARCKISSHSFVCEGVTIEEGVFIGHGVMFTNDAYPRAVNEDNTLQSDSDWAVIKTLVKKNASVGSGVTILPGITIGEGAMIGAGSVVTKDVPEKVTVVGNPARAVSI
jgi:acetyltransferase-like isoleucine patch superfamily enzyme